MSRGLEASAERLAVLDAEEDLLQTAINESKESFESKRTFEHLRSQGKDSTANAGAERPGKKRKAGNASPSKAKGKSKASARRGKDKASGDGDGDGDGDGESGGDRTRGLIPKAQYRNGEDVVVHFEGRYLQCAIRQTKRVVALKSRGRRGFKDAKADEIRYKYRVRHRRIRCRPLDEQWFPEKDVVRLPPDEKRHLKDFFACLPPRVEAPNLADVEMLSRATTSRATRRNRRVEDEALRWATEQSLAEEARRKAEERKAKKRERCDLHGALPDGTGPSQPDQWVRRSFRNVTKPLQEDRRVKLLYERIRLDCPSLTVLKLKDYFRTDVNPEFMDKFLDLMLQHCKTTPCQGLYIHNFSEAMTDAKLDKVITILKHSKIWALNIGENYEISTAGWAKFAEELKETWVTHMYMSEHIVSAELKTKMRDSIRLNRKKHSLHNSYSNKDVITRITNMWWNPSNSQKFQRELMEDRQRRQSVTVQV
uniref:Uncharacterized protein n=1 Tax=Pinguiococcus pyrenoidosus TaxID=172671 RepID=A0A7R9UCF2_9STRA|mmetsp:Transcript_5370/g.21284  ORF Transcript_5370/g.21284 Transcript_5370/m.21284 type:complete len:482 (+) Transcript_5370:40-1485(+)